MIGQPPRKKDLVFVFSQKGVTLTELLVTLAIMAVVSTGLMVFMKQQADSINTIESRYEAVDLLEEIRSIMADLPSCTQTLAGVALSNPIATGVFPLVKRGQEQCIYRVRGDIDSFGTQTSCAPPSGTTPTDPQDIPVFVANADQNAAPRYGNRKIRFLSFDVRVDDTASAPAANGQGYVLLRMYSLLPDGTAAPHLGKELRVFVYTDANNNIVSCGNEGYVTLAEMCHSLGGVFKPDGRGTNKPDCESLTLVGDFQTSTSLTIMGQLKLYFSLFPVQSTTSIPALRVISTGQLIEMDDQPPPPTAPSLVNDRTRATGRSFCHMLGGVFQPTEGMCEQLVLRGGLTVYGDVKVQPVAGWAAGDPADESGEIRAFRTAPPVNTPVPGLEGYGEFEYLCRTIGGIPSPAGRGDGLPNCHSIKVTKMSVVQTDSLKNVVRIRMNKKLIIQDE